MIDPYLLYVLAMAHSEQFFIALFAVKCVHEFVVMESFLVDVEDRRHALLHGASVAGTHHLRLGHAGAAVTITALGT